MLSNLLGWLKAILAYLSGLRAGEAKVQQAQVVKDNEVANEVAKAEASAPASRADTVDRLRSGSF